MRITIIKNGNIFNIRKESLIQSIAVDLTTLLVAIGIMYFNNFVVSRMWTFDLVAGLLIVMFLYYATKRKMKAYTEKQLLAELKRWKLGDTSSEIVDYQKVSEYLYAILDDIDSVGDIAKGDHEVFKEKVEYLHKFKSDVSVVVDDQVVFKNPEKEYGITKLFDGKK